MYKTCLQDISNKSSGMLMTVKVAYIHLIFLYELLKIDIWCEQSWDNVINDVSIVVEITHLISIKKMLVILPCG